MTQSLDGLPRMQALIDEATGPRCGHDVGSPPWWMSQDQWDPCSCIRPLGHTGWHACEHDVDRMTSLS